MLFRSSIKKVKEYAQKTKYASAIIIKKNTLEKYISRDLFKTNYEMSREDAIKILIDNLKGDGTIISTTGKTSRELFEYRIERNEKPRDFLTLGGMGCSVSIAAEIALQKNEKRIYCFDGDGAALMQLGALSTVGNYKPKNFTHIIFDNASYDSTGGQPTSSNNVNFAQVAKNCGYNHSKIVKTKKDLINSINNLECVEGPNMLVVKIKKGARKNLGRPTSPPIENKKAFMTFLEK